METHVAADHTVEQVETGLWDTQVIMPFQFCFLFLLNACAHQRGQSFTSNNDNTHNILHLISAPPLWTESSDAQEKDLTL